MKIAIDSYCYHRYFGEVYPSLETDPGTAMTLSEVVDRARTHEVEAVSLESFMLPDSSPASVSRLRRQLDDWRLDRMWAWGHPRGLESGLAPGAMEDLLKHIDVAQAVGARVMRICAGGRKTRVLTWREHKALLLPLLQQAADYAAARDIELAIENHIDFLADELVELLETIAHPALGACLDTANNLRMLENPSRAIELLAPFTKAVHLKDVTAFKGSPHEFGFWPSVPVGKGLIDIPFALDALKRADYSGLLAIEIDYLHPAHGSEDGAISQSVGYVRQLLSAGVTPETVREPA